MKEDQPKTQRVSQTNGKLEAKLQYLNELRYLVPHTVNRNDVRERIERVCDSIERDLGL